MKPGLDPEVLRSIQSIAQPSVAPQQSQSIDPDILKTAQLATIQAENRRKYLRDQFVWGLVAPLSGTRHVYAKRALKEVTDPTERQWLTEEVARISDMIRQQEQAEYAKSGRLSRFGKHAQKIGGSFAEAGTGIVEAGTKLAKSLVGKGSSAEDVKFLRALDAAKESANPYIPEGANLPLKAATGAAGMAPDLAAGLLAGAAGGTAGMAGYWTARLQPERREDYLEMGASPAKAAVVGTASAAAEGAVELMMKDPTGLTKGAAAPVKGALRRGIVKAAGKVGGEGARRLAKHPVTRRAVAETIEAGKRTAVESFEEGVQGSVEEGGKYLVAKTDASIEDRAAGDIPMAALEQMKAAAPGIAVTGGVGAGAKTLHTSQRYRRLTVARRERIQREIVEAAEKGETPSRSQWKAWGLPEEDGMSKQQRTDYIQEIARKQGIVDKVKQQADAPSVEQQSPPTEQQPQPPSVNLGHGWEGSNPPVETPPTEPQATPEEPQAPPEEPQQERPAAPDEAPAVTSIKNEVVNDLRTQRKLDPVSDVTQESQEQWLDRASRRITKDPTLPDRLVREIEARPRVLNDEETAVMQIHYRRLHNAFAASADRLIEANQTGDEAEIERAGRESDLIYDQLDQVERAAKSAGREWGRAGVARQIELATDYSLAGLTRRARVAKGGKELTPEEMESVKKTSEKIAELQQKHADKEQTADDSARERAVDETIKQAKKSKRLRKAATKKAEAQANVQKAWAEFRSIAGKKRGEQGGLVAGEGGALDLELVGSALKVAKAYAELGVATFSEFYASAINALGDEAAESRDALRAAWRQLEDDGTIEKTEIDPDDTAGVSRLARKLTRFVVEAGITEREAVVDAVHEELSQVVDGITRRQTMDAMSGYGQYRELDKDDVSVAIRDINGQLQQLAKLEDMRKGKAPSKTGVERREPSDEERRLIQQVNEAKKAGGFDVTDPAKQLKSALDAAKTAIRNRIADLEHEIQTRQRNVSTRRELTPDAELTALRKRRDELREEHAKIFPKQPMTDAQRIAAAEKALDRAIAQLEADLKAGNIGPKAAKPKLSSPTLDAKRARLDELRANRDELRELANPKPSLEERQLAAYKRSLKKRLADYKRRIAEGDITKREVKHVQLDREATDLKFELEAEKTKFKTLEEQIRRSQWSRGKKIAAGALELLNASRALMTSMDFSAVFRQGGFAVASHPILAAKALPEMFRAFRSKRGEFEAIEELRNRPNYYLYQQSKLAVTTTEGKLSSQEEAFMGRWAKKIPGVAGSERAYVTFLNRMRADVFDSMVSSLSANGKPTSEEAAAIANFVNVATGRGSMGSMSAAAVPLATVFFSPRYMISRFQLLAGQPAWKGNASTRKLVAKEYGRALIGLGTFYSLCMLAAMFNADDDDKVTIEFDPRSADFGKVRIGDTRIDPLAGLSQATVLVSRLASGETKRSTGEVVPVRGNVPFGAESSPELISRFLRGKLSPWLGSAVDVVSGTNIVGEPVTVPTLAARSFVPLSFSDIYEVMQSEKIERSTALSLLAIFGMGVQNYQSAAPEGFAKRIATGERLKGVNATTRERFDRREEVEQIVAQAKREGLTVGELSRALAAELRAKGAKPDTIRRSIQRLRARYNAS